MCNCNKTRCKKCKKGRGIGSFIKNNLTGFLGKRVISVLQGKRKGATKRFDDFLDKDGTKQITDIQIARKPVIGVVQKALDALSFGNFSKTKKNLGYDDIYHNYLLVSTADGKRYRVEKNHVIGASEASDSDYTNAEKIDIPTDRPINIKELIKNSARGDKNYYQYDPAIENCQQFCKDVINRNDLQPNSEKGANMLQPQNGKELVGSLGTFSFIPKVITDGASIGDRFIYGDGMNKAKRRRKHY